MTLVVNKTFDELGDTVLFLPFGLRFAEHLLIGYDPWRPGSLKEKPYSSKCSFGTPDVGNLL